MKKRLFYMLPVILMAIMGSCASENATDDNQSAQPIGRKLRKLTITQNGTTRSAVGTTRSILIDKGEEGIYASWEMGDELTVYNKTYPQAGYATIKATSSTKTANFSGNVDCEVNDKLRFFYPSISNEGVVTDLENTGTLTLDISKQKGTLEDIQLHYDFNYGEATITATTDETATGDAGLTEYISAICKFTFKCNKEYVKEISSVEISNVVPSATFALSARNAPELTLSDAGKIDIISNKVDNFVYVTLFPGVVSPTFTVMATDGKYEGTLSSSTLIAGKFYDVVVETTRTGEGIGGGTSGGGGNVGGDEPPSNDYVEVCGIKWARGNLQYDPVSGGDEGFVENWRVAPIQWNYVSTLQDEKKDCFGWGVINEMAYDYSSTRALGGGWNQTLATNRIISFFPEESIDIESKLYSKFFSGGNYSDYASGQAQYTETTVHDNAKYGDVAYYVSYGKYRLPTKDEFVKLITESSIQYGFIVTPEGRACYGYLFSNPESEKTVSYEERQIFLSELSKGLFLPGENSAVKTLSFGWGTNNQARSSLEKNGTCYYWSSLFSKYAGGTLCSVSVYGLKMDASSVDCTTIYTVRHTHNSSTDIHYCTYNYCMIRPVLCE